MNETTYPEPMPSAEFADAMRAIITKYKITRIEDIDGYDVLGEAGHVEADDLMCELLKSLGYGEGVEVLEDMDKWYG